eukprot:TRINITY_DN592_c0_g1_i3.p1 TRINITY_DN592_c0_g1~~TRINITY_DN592_c0_g1_i3.p1  ORF type:complete len:444 (-),score=107.91 TRINITY_DN592_c0_g1_i3:97-1428(-)
MWRYRNGTSIQRGLLLYSKYTLKNQQPGQQQSTPHQPSNTPTISKTKGKATLDKREDNERDKQQKALASSIKISSLENILSSSTTSSMARAKKKEAVLRVEPEPYDALFDAKMTVQNFNLIYVIGKGGFGKVWKVETKKTRTFYAMKEMLKARILSKRSVNSVMNERYLLSYLKNPFLVNMVCAFQDRDNVFLVMDLLTGGDLRFHICKRRRFTEEQTKFVVACILVALEYLHNNGILHRDIKPENIVLDSKGFCRVTDLGIARVWRSENAQDTSGTPGYMAPEVMCRQNHGVAVDYFALGVIAYEMMLGKRPYLGKSRKEIKEQILAKQVQVKKQEIPEDWSTEAGDFINQLIQRKPSNRLGLNGPQEVKAHPWIKNYPWTKLLNKEITPPFQPSRREEDNFDKQQTYDDLRDPYADLDKENALLLRRDSVQALFNGYTFEC